MKSLIHIGHDAESNPSKKDSKAIIKILKTCFDCRMDQETTRFALRAFRESSEIKNITVTNCTLKGNKE